MEKEMVLETKIEIINLKRKELLGIEDTLMADFIIGLEDIEAICQTAEDILNSIEPNGELLNTDTAVEAMIQFAKLHVQAALESAAEKLPYDDRLNQDMLVKQSILNAYPLDNIK